MGQSKQTVTPRWRAGMKTVRLPVSGQCPSECNAALRHIAPWQYGVRGRDGPTRRESGVGGGNLETHPKGVEDITFIAFPEGLWRFAPNAMHVMLRFQMPDVVDEIRSCVVGAVGGRCLRALASSRAEYGPRSEAQRLRPGQGVSGVSCDRGSQESRLWSGPA